MIRRAYRFWRQHGASAAGKRAASILLRAGRPAPLTDSPLGPEHLIQRKYIGLSPLPVATALQKTVRINLVTDSVNTPYLYGGVRTAIILAGLLADRACGALRIITRWDRAHEENVVNVLRLVGIAMPHALVDFVFAPYGSSHPKIEVDAAEHFITTSWWTTYGTAEVIPPSRIIYLLQEDERLFYPCGDEYLRCLEVLTRPDILLIVNTRLLFDHLRESVSPTLADRALWFEPSFPEALFHAAPSPFSRPPYRLFFYARPNNERNLFYRGIEAIQAAMTVGILGRAQWELHFAGKDIPNVRFGPDVVPRRHENLQLEAYADLVRTIDLGLCLMSSPHPSYPPLDLAASGAVVVTNRFGGKTHLDHYSKNIICVDPTLDDLTRGIGLGVKLALDANQRLANYRQNGLLRDWRVSFSSILDLLAEKLRGQAPCADVGPENSRYAACVGRGLQGGPKA
jgi:hypothetical protein